MDDLAKISVEFLCDCIGRVVPGVVAVLAWSFATGFDLLGTAVKLLDGSDGFAKSNAAVLLVLLLMAYVIGHLIAPFSGLIHSCVLPTLFPHHFNVLKHLVVQRGDTQAMRDFYKAKIEQLFGVDVSISASAYRQSTYMFYEWVRLSNPDDGVRLGKMRAEYRMLEGLNVVFLISIGLQLFDLHPGALSNQNRLFHLLLLVCIFLVCVWATARFFRTYQWAVLNQYYHLSTNRSALQAD